MFLLLVTVELITMPLTQHVWAWDGFVQGGQDFELGLLMIVMCVCLGLLRAQHGRLRVSLLLAVRQWLMVVWRPRVWLRLLLPEGLTLAASDPPSLLSIDFSATPLRI